MKVINLTPHDVNICDDYGHIIKTYKTSGIIARVANGFETIDYVDGTPIVCRTNERIVNLPEPEEDTVYIVSNVILDYCLDRMDLLAPVQQVRINGQVVGCRSFMSNR